MFAGNVAGVIFLSGAALFRGNHTGLMLSMVLITIIYIIMMFAAKETKLEKQTTIEQ